MGTQIVAVRSLLIDGIKNAPALADVECSFGYRVGSRQRQRVYTQNATFTHEPASLRAVKTFREESGSFEVSVWIEGVSQSARWSATRAVEIGLVIEEWVAVHANWEGALPGLKSIKVQGDGSLDEAFNDKGTLAQLILPVRYNARLT